MRWEGHPRKCTCRPKRAFPLRKCPLGQLGEMRNDISASSRALDVQKGEGGVRGSPTTQWCVHLTFRNSQGVRNRRTCCHSICAGDKDIGSILGSVSLLNTPNADSKLHPLPHPSHLWSCEYKLIASLNLATASAYCWDNANRLASAGGSGGQGTRRRTRSHCR